MEITLDAIISLITLFTGGGCGTFFTWRWMKHKARSEAMSAEAEAKQKEAEAEQARIEANKQVQDMYKTMFEDIKQNYDEKQAIIDELRRDRDHYKDERDELRDKVEKLQKSIFEWKQLGEEERMKMKQDIARLGRQYQSIAPLACADLRCKLRKRVVISDGEDAEQVGEIEPYDDKDNA